MRLFYRVFSEGDIYFNPIQVKEVRAVTDKDKIKYPTKDWDGINTIVEFTGGRWIGGSGTLEEVVKEVNDALNSEPEDG
jgi:hypothetical protein